MPVRVNLSESDIDLSEDDSNFKSLITDSDSIEMRYDGINFIKKTRNLEAKF